MKADPASGHRKEFPMRGFHFSLRWLFGVVSFLAIACGLLFYASPFLSKLTFTATLVMLLAATFSAAYHAGGRRAFWAGFAVFGFPYLWLTCGLWQSPDGSTPVRERLVTSDLLIRCHEVLPSRQTSMTMTTTPVTTGSVTYTGAVAYDPYSNAVQTTMMPGGATPPGPLTMTSVILSTTVDRTDFLTTGHSLFAIVFALLGGVIARSTYRRARSIQSATSAG
jgi:hypothetical protein